MTGPTLGVLGRQELARRSVAGPCSQCGGRGRVPDPPAVQLATCLDCRGTGRRHIVAGRVVRGDRVYLPAGRGRLAVEVTAVTGGYRPQDRRLPDEQRQRRRIVGRPVGDDGQVQVGLPSRAWLRPFGESLQVIRLSNDPPEHADGHAASSGPGPDPDGAVAGGAVGARGLVGPPGPAVVGGPGGPAGARGGCA